MPYATARAPGAAPGATNADALVANAEDSRRSFSDTGRHVPSFCSTVRNNVSANADSESSDASSDASSVVGTLSLPSSEGRWFDPRAYAATASASRAAPATTFGHGVLSVALLTPSATPRA